MQAWFGRLGAAAMAVVLAGAGAPATAQTAKAPAEAKPTMNPAPARRANEGLGPYRKLVIRGVTLIDGTGAPPRGPVDIVIENDKIAEVRQAGWPGLALKADREPRDAVHEIDATGMYALPGFVDMHTHGGDPKKSPNLEYAYKLWLAHGVTTVRGVSLAPHDIAVVEKARSARGEIVAPRIYNYQTLGSGWSGGRIDGPVKARAWVQWASKNGVDGIKFFGWNDETPEVMTAALDEAKKVGLGTVAHIAQPGVANINARQFGELGLGTVTHFYGHFESMLKDGRLQKYPADYNFYDEAKRFGEAAEIWDEVDPGSDAWFDYLKAPRAT
jgi:imidazolonepropionase-like amidohydrolase